MSLRFLSQLWTLRSRRFYRRRELKLAALAIERCRTELHTHMGGKMDAGLVMRTARSLRATVVALSFVNQTHEGTLAMYESELAAWDRDDALQRDANPAIEGSWGWWAARMLSEDAVDLGVAGVWP